MKASIIALGAAGAHFAESLLYASVSGVLQEQDFLRVTLFLPPAGEEERLQALFHSYEKIRSGFSAPPPVGFHPALSLNTVSLDAPLPAQARTPGDQLLLRALFTDALTSADVMTASADTAAAQWQLLFQAPDGALASVLKDASEMPTLLFASLSEVCGGSGAGLFLHALRRHTDQPVGAVLLTGFLKGAESVSADLPELRFLTLLGLPEDCRVTEDKPHLIHLLSVRAAQRFLSGEEGHFAFALPLEKYDWSAFDPDGAMWGLAFHRLLIASTLWRISCAPVVLRAVESSGLLLERFSPWLRAAVPLRRSDPQARELTASHVREISGLFHAVSVYLLSIQHSMPYLFRTTPAQLTARRDCAAHYQDVLRAAGETAVIAFDIERSELEDQQSVHRHGMTESEDEKVLRERDEHQAFLQELCHEQELLSKPLGTRWIRSMLSGYAAQAQQELSDLARQAEEAQRRIEQAQAQVTPEEQSMVDQAKNKYYRLEQRIARARGRQEQCEKDLREAEASEIRLPSDAEEPFVLFCPEEWLQAVVELPEEDSRSRRRAAHQLEAAWPWQQPGIRSLQEYAARCPSVAPDGALQLMSALLRAVGGSERR